MWFVLALACMGFSWAGYSISLICNACVVVLGRLLIACMFGLQGRWELLLDSTPTLYLPFEIPFCKSIPAVTALASTPLLSPEQCWYYSVLVRITVGTICKPAIHNTRISCETAKGYMQASHGIYPCHYSPYPHQATEIIMHPEAGCT